VSVPAVPGAGDEPVDLGSPDAADGRDRAVIERDVFAAGMAAGLGDARDLPVDTHLHTVRSPDAQQDALIDAYCALALERGIAELAITDHVDFDPTMPAYGFATFEDRERDVREAQERWADRGIAIRFGVEVTYERAYEDDIRTWLAAHPHDFVIGSVHISATSPYKASNVASFVSGRPLPGIVGPYFDEIIGAARSGLFDTIGHLDFVKRYLVPHVLPSTLAAAPELYEPVLRAIVDSGTALEVNSSGLRQLPRETYPSAAIVARYRELGGRHVTIGSDAHRSGWFAYGLAEAYRHATRAGFDALAFRRGGDRVTIPIPPEGVPPGGGRP
jgi:histidinol-phosphatase (PHP family)